MSHDEIEKQIEILSQLPTLNRSVYVIAETEAGPCKIGFSMNPDKRAVLLRTLCKIKGLRVWHETPHDNAPSVEQLAHKRLKDRHDPDLPGREWFNVSVEQAIAVVSEAAQATETRKNYWRRKPDNMRRWFLANQKYPLRTTPEAVLNYRFED